MVTNSRRYCDGDYMGRPKKLDLAGIEQRPEGGYHCFVDLGRRPDGRRHVKHISGKTKLRVAEKRKAVLDRAGEGLRSDGAKMTFGRYMQNWLAGVVGQERREYSDNTMDDYRDAVERLTPLIGNLRMDGQPRELTKCFELAAAHLRREGAARGRLPKRLLEGHPARTWALERGLDVKNTGRVPADILAAWRAEGSPVPATRDLRGVPYESLSEQERQRLKLSRVYVRNIMGKLSMICNEAVRDGYLRINPVHGARLPEAKADREKVVFSPDQVRAVTARVTGRDLIRWSLAVGMGLRQGEVLGLRWSRLDLDRGTALIDTQAQRRSWQHGCRNPSTCESAARRCPDRHGGGMYLKETTKEEDDGRIPISPQLVAILRGHRKSQVAERLAAGQLWNDNDLVYCTPEGGIVDRSNDNKHWHRVLRENGLPPAGTHSAKHTAITLAFDAGVDDLLVSRFIGRHASGAAFTRKQYQHVLDGRAREMAENMGAVIFGQAGEGG